jgi:PAS domain S-box-containing protein
MSLCILLIDDNPNDRLFIKRELSQELKVVEFIEALNAQDLTEIVALKQFDLVVLDYQLSWGNGLQILHLLKRHYSECPVIMFTNSGNEEIAVKGMKAGLDDYVVKCPQHYHRLSVSVKLLWERVTAQQRAKTLETELKFLLNRLNIGVFRATAQGQLLEGNIAFLNLLGVQDLAEAQELLGTSWTLLLNQLSQDDSEQPQWREIQLHRLDGTRIWIQASLTLRDNLGQPIIDGLIENISERKQIEAERARLLASEQSARAEAESANRLKDEFLAIVSHELRSPLNAILGWATLLRTRKFDEFKAARAIESIERNAKLQTQLIEDLLDISRLIRGKLRLNARSIDLQKVVDAAIETVRSTADAKGIILSHETYAEMANVVGDLGRLQQIIWNLLSNAIKFTEPGGQVMVRLQIVGRFAQIQVSDTGKGISPHFLPYLFDRFRQENSGKTRTSSGLGLGLAIVRQLVELHGGTVSADSLGEGHGSTFTVSLPLETPEADRDAETGENSVPLLSNDNSALEGIRVLVVDDEADAREFLSAVLEEYGAHMATASSVIEALQIINQWQPNVIVSDIGMPNEDGYMLMRRLQEHGIEIPTLALTAYARDEDIKESLAAGFQVHLIKPIEPAKLVSAILNLKISQ